MRRRRKKAWVWLWIAAAVPLLALGIFARPSNNLSRYDVSYEIIDLKSGGFKVSPALANDSSEEFSAMMSRLKPYAAVCGTYYDENRRPLGDIVMNGKVASRGCQRQAIGFTRTGGIVFRERKGRGRIDWQGCASGLACGPRLLRSGKIDINVKRDGFGQAAATNQARRCAVGATADGKLIICAVPKWITLSTLAFIMLDLGAVDAINLDGGSMCAFYSRGECKVEPSASMSNVLAVYRR